MAQVVRGEHDDDVLGGGCSQVRQDDGCGGNVRWAEVSSWWSKFAQRGWLRRCCLHDMNKKEMGLV